MDCLEETKHCDRTLVTRLTTRHLSHLGGIEMARRPCRDRNLLTRQARIDPANSHPSENRKRPRENGMKMRRRESLGSRILCVLCSSLQTGSTRGGEKDTRRRASVRGHFQYIKEDFLTLYSVHAVLSQKQKDQDIQNHSLLCRQ
jgi:hypothetical protein